jgi:hypothetical protein
VYLPVGQPVNIECVKCARACGSDDLRHLAGDRFADSIESENLSGEDPDIALAMYSAELDYLFFERGRVRLCVGEHQLLREGVVDPVGFDVKVMVVTDDKCHLVQSTSNEQNYKIFSIN